MKILVFEDNLLWSSRLVKTLKSLGHEPLVRTKPLSNGDGATVAIVNLGMAKLNSDELIPQLRGQGIHVIGHAGHKESELLTFGREAGCDTLATNSELTFKIESLLQRISPATG